MRPARVQIPPPAILVIIFEDVEWGEMVGGGGVRYDWPDFVHVDYGFPMRWATHTLITLTGPADHWSVDLVMLLVDVGFWQTVLIIGMLVLELKIIKR
jgi:hypothetical protein